MKTNSAPPPSSRYVLLRRRSDDGATTTVRTLPVRRLTLVRRIDPWPALPPGRHSV